MISELHEGLATYRSTYNWKTNGINLNNGISMPQNTMQTYN
jgi:hypothetical protein